MTPAMRIKEITYRHRNDFHYIAECEHCGKEEIYGDGYADHFYCTRVVPEGRFCPSCERNSYGQTSAEREQSLKVAETV